MCIMLDPGYKTYQVVLFLVYINDLMDTTVK